MSLKTLFSCISLSSLFFFGCVNAKEPIVNKTYDNARLKAAGVLPYALGPDGKVYVLLGRQSISSIPSSGLWKGFGGKRDSGEILVQTAIREAREEMKGVFGKDSNLYHLQKFPFHETIATEHTHFKYLQLMAPVAFDPTIPEKFMLLSGDTQFEKEKLEIRWVKCEDLYLSIKEGHALALEQNCYASEINRLIHVKSGNDYLPLAKDFVETLVTNFCNPEDSFHKLGENIMPVEASFSSDAYE